MKAEFDEIKKLLGDIVKQLGDGAEPSAERADRPVRSAMIDRALWRD